MHQTPKVAAVGHLVEEWAKKQYQTKIKTKTQGGVFYHLVAVTGARVWFA